MKEVLFIILFAWSAAKVLLRQLVFGPTPVPWGIRGLLLLHFVDPDYPGKTHGVVAFALPQGSSAEQIGELFGPFGYERQVHSWLLGIHLYGRDSWGFVKQAQLAANPQLQQLASGDNLILLAGVRRCGGTFIWPLNNPRRFILTLQ